MPTPPSIPEKVNYIVNYWENPCHARWWLIIETAKAPAWQALVAVSTFGMYDIIRGYLRPKVGRFKRTPRTKKGKSWWTKSRGRIPQIPEVGATVGGHLPGAQLAAGRNVSGGVLTLWALDEIVQRFLWYWLLIDVATDFFYTWASNLNESRFCSSQGKAGFAATGGPYVITGIQGWNNGSAVEVDYEENGAHWDGFAGGTGNGSHVVALGITARNIHPTLTNQLQCRIRWGPGLGNIVTSEIVAVEPGASGSVTILTRVPEFQDVTFQISCSPGNAEVTTAMIFAQQVGSG